MPTNFSALQKSELFSGINEDDLKKLFECVSPKKRSISKGSFVFNAGDKVRLVYFILSGSMHIVDEDFWGNNSIIETLPKNTLFGEAYVFSSMQNHLVSVVAAEDSEILEINPQSLFSTCPNGCKYHARLVRNTLSIVSEKIVRLTEKLGHVMRRTLREKLLSYLTKCAQKEKKDSFDIPYSRQQLADYLCADRSALSHELSKLQEQGLLRYRKNHFKLLDKRELY